MAEALHRDNYEGVISFESVYHPGDGDFEAGFERIFQPSLNTLDEFGQK